MKQVGQILDLLNVVFFSYRQACIQRNLVPPLLKDDGTNAFNQQGGIIVGSKQTSHLESSQAAFD